jgi:DNA replication protein DnaC
MFETWNNDKLKNLDFTEKFILNNSYLPRYQWVEDSLKALDDSESFKRLVEIRKDLSHFLSSELNNLVICSSNLGNGKTSWAVKLMLTYIEMQKGKLDYVDEKKINVDNYDYCVFCQSVPFLVEMKQFGSNKKSYEMYQRLCRTNLAIIDDLGAASMSQYDYNIIYAIFEKRLFEGRPTIVTTNFANKESAEKELGPRLVDRIWSNSEIIEFKNRGFRGV